MARAAHVSARACEAISISDLTVLGTSPGFSGSYRKSAHTSEVNRYVSQAHGTPSHRPLISDLGLWNGRPFDCLARRLWLRDRRKGRHPSGRQPCTGGNGTAGATETRPRALINPRRHLAPTDPSGLPARYLVPSCRRRAPLHKIDQSAFAGL